MIIKEIKDDLISEAELIIYQMKSAQINDDFQTITERASQLSDICHKLEFVRQAEEKFHREFDF